MSTVNPAAVMADLDRARNFLNYPLTIEGRARLFAALEDPESGWLDARSLILRPNSLRQATLWQCVLAATGDTRLELALAVPTAEQIAAGLAWATR